MGSRRITLNLGAAAGGLLAAAFLPMSVAFADDASDASAFDQFFQDFFGFNQDTSIAPTFYSISGEPPLFQSVHLAESFDTNPTDTLPAGSFQVDNEVITSAFGPASAELLVTSSEQGTSAPPVGSVYDVIDIGHGFENVYSDIAPTTPGGTDTLSDTLVTPFGDIPIKTDLHAYLDPTDSYYLYNTTDPLAVGPADPLAVTSANDATGANSFFDQLFGNFYGFDYDASQPTTVTDIAAIPPLYQSVHQTESFNTSPTDTLPAGSFQADDNILWNTKGPHFSELLVTSSTPGTSAPPVGSVYEINNMGNGSENFYSDIAPTTPGGQDTLSDTLVTPSGNIPMPTGLHAFFDPKDAFFPYDNTDPSAVDTTDPSAVTSAGFDPSQPFAFFGFEHDTSEPTTVTAVSGILPTLNSIHQTQVFDTDPTGTLQGGSFEAAENVITKAAGLTNESILVTSSDQGPPVGSVFDVFNFGHGFENFYSDIAPLIAGGHDTLSDTLVTPFGDIPLMIDFSAFLDPANSFFLY